MAIKFEFNTLNLDIFLSPLIYNLNPLPPALHFCANLFSQVVDTASGALVVDLQAHEGSLWSLAVRPDGKGFVTASADKEVKFWDFTVSPAL